jgi:hypothetical protein
MNKFEIGDRVKIVNRSSDMYNMLATVVVVFTLAGVGVILSEDIENDEDVLWFAFDEVEVV